MCVDISASKLVNFVQNLAAQSGVTSMTLVFHVSNHSELYTFYSVHSNGCEGIQFLEASGRQGRKAQQRNDNRELGN